MSLLACLAQALQTLQPGQMPNDKQPCLLTNLYTATDEPEKSIATYSCRWIEIKN